MFMLTVLCFGLDKRKDWESTKSDDATPALYRSHVFARLRFEFKAVREDLMAI